MSDLFFGNFFSSAGVLLIEPTQNVSDDFAISHMGTFAQIPLSNEVHSLVAVPKLVTLPPLVAGSVQALPAPKTMICPDGDPPPPAR